MAADEEVYEGEAPYEERGQDASRYLSEMRKEALGVLFPHPKEMEERIPLITTLSGKPPNIVTLYLAAVEWEGWLAMEKGRPIDWMTLEPTEFLRIHAPSLAGKRASQAVEIARATPQPEKKRGLIDFLRGGH